MTRHSTTLKLVRNNLRSGLTLGAGAYLVGYLSTFVLAFLLGELSGSGQFSVWKRVGWLFAGLHHVALKMTVDGETKVVQPIGESVLEAGSLGDFVLLFGLRLSPALVLIWAGYRLYQRAGRSELDTKGTAKMGAVVTVGYLTATLIGRQLSATRTTVTRLVTEHSVVAAPDLLGSVVLMGFVYPVVFGALGALVAKRRGVRPADEERRGERTTDTRQWHSP